MTADWTYVPWALRCSRHRGRVHAHRTTHPPLAPGSLIGIVIVTLLALFLPTRSRRSACSPRRSRADPPHLRSGDTRRSGDACAHRGGARRRRVAPVRARRRDPRRHRPLRPRSGARRPGTRVTRLGAVRRDAGDRRHRAHRRQRPLRRSRAPVRRGAHGRCCSSCSSPPAAVGTIPSPPRPACSSIDRVPHGGAPHGAARSCDRRAQMLLAFIVTALVTVSFDLIVMVGIGILCAGFFLLRGLPRDRGAPRGHRGRTPSPDDDHIAVITWTGRCSSPQPTAFSRP